MLVVKGSNASGWRLKIGRAEVITLRNDLSFSANFASSKDGQTHSTSFHRVLTSN